MGAADAHGASLDAGAFDLSQPGLEGWICNTKLLVDLERVHLDLSGPDRVSTGSDQDTERTLKTIFKGEDIVLGQDIAHAGKTISSKFNRAAVTVARQDDQRHNMIKVHHGALVIGCALPLQESGVQCWVVRRNLDLASVAITIRILGNCCQLETFCCRSVLWLTSDYEHSNNKTKSRV